MMAESKSKAIGIIGCIVFAAIFGLISVAYDYCEYAILLDMFAWMLVLGGLFYSRMRQALRAENTLTFWTGFLFVIGISAVIITWAPWSLDALWENRGNTTPSGLIFLSGLCTFGMFFFSTVGLLFPLRWSGLISFRKKASRLFLAGLLLIAGVLVSMLLSEIIIWAMGVQGSIRVVSIWLTETVTCLSLFLVWYFILAKKWFDADLVVGGRVAGSASRNSPAAVILLMFPLAYSIILLAVSYANHAFFEESFAQSLLMLLFALGPWIIIFYAFFSLTKDHLSRSRRSVFVMSLLMGLCAWSRGGTGFIWGFPVGLSSLLNPLSVLYFWANLASDFLGLLVCSLGMLLAVCWLKELDWKKALSKKSGSLCGLSLFLTGFLATTETVIAKIPLEDYFLSMQLFVFPTLVVICFIFFHVYYRTLSDITQISYSEKLPDA